MTEKIKVLYVEDDPEWSKGIQDFFFGHEKIDLFACASSVEECFLLLQKDDADIVLMDIILGGGKASGLDAALDITIQYPKVKVIMLSSLDDNDEIFNEAFMNGAYDYLYKYDFDKLPEAILEATSNRASKYGERLRKLVYDKKRSLLSSRDKELLIMILDGKTQQQIADELYVGLGAVKKQVGRILKKFNWEQSSKSLAEKCKKWGLLDSES